MSGFWCFDMRDDKETVVALIAKCHVYKLERLALLKVINDLSKMLYDKFQSQDQEEQIRDGDDKSASV